MTMTRAQKSDHIEGVRATFQEANTLYLVDLCGLTVNEVNDLRGKLREAGCGLRVVRNRLAKRALSEEAAGLEAYFNGPTALAHHPAEPISPAKVLTTFAKDHPRLEIKAGLVERRQLVDAEEVKAIAALPGLDETRAMLLSLINQPATTLVRLISTPATQVARVVQARGESEDRDAT